jgi:iron complex transport system substrate-binding protein
LFVVGRTPGLLEGLVTFSKSAYLNELIELAGGENVFRDAPSSYPKVSLEEVLARNPEVILDMGDMGDTDQVTEQQRRQAVALWSRLSSVDAVRRGRVYAVTSDIFIVPGPRIVEAARELARRIHPEARF